MYDLIVNQQTTEWLQKPGNKQTLTSPYRIAHNAVTEDSCLL